MWKIKNLSPWLLAASLLCSPIVWADTHDAKTQAATDSSDWLKLQEVVKKLDKEGHQEILSVTQTGRGYFARVIDKDGRRLHLWIDPTTGKSTPQDAKDLKGRRHGHQTQSHHKRAGEQGHHYNKHNRGYYYGKKGMHPHPHHGARPGEKKYRIQPEPKAK